MNGEKVISIDHLRTDHSTGGIGLFALFSNRFSNFKITHKDAVENSEKMNNNPNDPNIIKQWGITKARPYKEEELFFNDFLKEKYIKKSSSGNFEQNIENYTIITTTVDTNKKDTKLFSFDYSDKIIVCLNGKVIFKGNNAFRAKGVQYMGHMDINTNKLYLALEKGVNKIHCVVIDKANGWGIMGKLE